MHQNNPMLPRMKVAHWLPAAAIVQSSKFIGRTFLLGNYNTLQLYPSDNILQYNKRVLKKQCNYHCFGKRKCFCAYAVRQFGLGPRQRNQY